MGYFNGDWTYEQYSAAVQKALQAGQERVSLNTEHCCYLSDELLTMWADRDGYRALLNGDNVVVVLREYGERLN